LNKKKLKRDLDSYQETQRAEDYKDLTFTVVLVQPEHAANIGSIARIMANFDFEKLVIFNPIERTENIFSYEAHGFAMHGKDILLKTQIIEVEEQENHLSEFKTYLNQFDLVLATTAKGKSYTNIKRLAIFPEDLVIPSSLKPLKIAILFGRESRGLTNDEISLVDILLRIPTGANYPTLNVSHACGIILYEVFKKINRLTVGRGKKPVLFANREDRQTLYKLVNSVLEKLKIRPHKKENIYFAFRNIFERTFMSRKELSLISGVFSKIYRFIDGLHLFEE
jgi:TrmH family RNA methyltransferase